jgi:hypothetical protein
VPVFDEEDALLELCLPGLEFDGELLQRRVPVELLELDLRRISGEGGSAVGCDLQRSIFASVDVLRAREGRRTTVSRASVPECPWSPVVPGL